MKFNKLIPELSVRNLKKSIEFYVDILGFKIEYDRPEKKFAFLSFNGSQIMLDECNNNTKSSWYTGKITHPRGRGIHFQIETDNLSSVIKPLKNHNYPIKDGPKKHWFRKGKYMLGVKGILVMDPDGYLLMFNQNIGKKLI
jgi:catechol 2,3-dioxygenase-like lactoylglutathione lyase family enzyme